MKKPNFFIIGAPKCGTTSLATWLRDHPQVYFSPIKEPHYFNTDGLQTITNHSEYEELFQEATIEHSAVGEGSTHYLYSREAVPNILRYAPHAKFIVCVRNPVEMAPALHSERLAQGREDVSDFFKAWSLQGERANGRHLPPTLLSDSERLQYGNYCKLGFQVERLLNLISLERVLFLVLDDIQANARQQYERVQDFLGLGDDGRREFRALNQRRETKYARAAILVRRLSDVKKRLGVGVSLGFAQKIKSLNTSSTISRHISQSEEEILRQYFFDDVRVLESSLNRDLGHWLAQ